uniref:Uncharacterized protein n=1 Tax=Oryza punctata TaxID=4537 RepID=A0A0E0LMN2_ORYPU
MEHMPLEYGDLGITNLRFFNVAFNKSNSAGRELCLVLELQLVARRRFHFNQHADAVFLCDEQQPHSQPSGMPYNTIDGSLSLKSQVDCPYRHLLSTYSCGMFVQ